MNQDAMKTRTCYFRDLCINPQTKRFQFYRGKLEQLATHTRLPGNLSLGWDTGFEFDIINDNIPKSAIIPSINTIPTEKQKSITWVLYASNRDETTWTLENVLRDEIFAWWLTVAHAPWSSSYVIPISLFSMTTMMPNPLLTSSFLSWIKLFFPYLKETGPIHWNELLLSSALNNGRQEENNPTIICLPRSVVGIQVMSDHCLAKTHEWRVSKAQPPNYRSEHQVGVKSVPCTAGRGPLYWRLRVEGLDHAGLLLLPPTAAAAAATATTTTTTNINEQIIIIALPFFSSSNSQVFLNSYGYSFDDVNSCMEKLSNDISLQNNKITIIKRVMGKLSVEQQLELVNKALVYITLPFGDSSVAAHFLQRGTSVLLVCDVLNKRMNFGYWNNLAYIRANWISKNIGKDELNQIITNEIDTSKVFVGN
jgi:hypothetical protein